MPRRLSGLFLALILGVIVVTAWTGATAQQDDSAEKGAFVRYVEETISTPDRQISLGSIEGALSSDVRISSITIADRQGVWLTINDVHLVWSRLALLRGRLDIDLLEAASIVVERTPLPAEAPPTPAASEPFALPDLPVEVVIDQLTVPEVVLQEPVLGEPVQMSVNGSIALADGTLDTKLAIERTDDKPGQLALTASYTADGQLSVDLKVDEPPDGVIANLIGIPDRPAVSLSVIGSGPLDNFEAEIALAAAGDRLLQGAVTVTADNGSYRFVTDLNGTLQPLFPPAYAPYFAGTSSLVINAVLQPDGSIAIQQADIRSGVANLQIAGALAPDGFPTRLSVQGTLTAENGGTVPLPGAADTASIAGATFALDFGGEGESWTARFDVAGLDTATVDAERAVIDAEGTATGLQDPAARSITATVSGAVTGVAAADPDLARALGDRFDLAIRAAWNAGNPVSVDIAEIKNPNAAVHFSGSVDGLTLDGRTWLNAADVAPFAGLAGQPLSGALTFESRGSVDVGTGALDLTFDATGEDLAIGVPQADALLAGTTTLSGQAVRNTGGLRFDDLRIANPQLQATLNGSYDLQNADLTLSAALENVSTLVDTASGPVALEARVTGSGVRPDIAATVTTPGLTLDGRRLTEGRLALDGSVDTETTAVDGSVSLSGFLDGVAIDGSADVASLADGTRRVSDLAFTAGGTRATGNVSLLPSGLATGRLSVVSPDISAVAPLALVDASGSIQADISLDAVDGSQSASVQATARNLNVQDTVSIGEAAVDLDVADLFGVPKVDGTVTASSVTAGGITVERLQATASHTDDTTEFELAATLEQGSLTATGALTAVEGGYDVALKTFQLQRSPELAATLESPVTVSVRDGRVILPRTTVGIGSGRITAEGTVADTLDLSLTVEDLPLSLANAVQPDLAAAGTLSGTVQVSGTPAEPTATFDVNASGVTAAPVANAGVPPLSVEASGRYTGNAVVLDATASGGGLTLSASGSVPVAGGSLDLAVRGQVPLGLAEPFLADRGARVGGTANVDLNVGGSLAAPAVTGGISVDNATFIDPETATRLTGISLRLSLNGQQAVIERLSGVLGGRGRIEVSGTVGLAPDAGFPADLAITARRARFTDGQIVTATFGANLQVTGPLLTGPRVTGRINIARAEITVPETLPGGVTFLDVRHRLPPPNVRRTLERVRRTTETRANREAPAAGYGLELDVTISAPDQVFVRGRGIDAELGGEVRITGSLSDIQPVGALNLIRGRVSVVGQRIDFDRGTVTLVGDLNPRLDFVASTRSDNIVVTAEITGVASDPQIVLSSVPGLPQDEVLARLLFDRSLSDLSPIQIASLAAAVAELAGAGGGPGILDKLRANTGLDDLAIVTDSEGNAAVEAGRYLTDNIYLGVTAGPGGANVSVNLDITEDFKAKVEVGPQSGSKVGVFYETEY